MAIQYHPSKVNVVANTLSENAVNMDSLACLGVRKQIMAK